MTLQRRQCLSHDEDFSKLPIEEAEKYKPKFFSDYNMHGCIMECRAMYSLDTCGCLPYYYPEFKDDANKNGTGCNVTQLECLSNISGRGKLMLTQIQNQFNVVTDYTKIFMLLITLQYSFFLRLGNS